MGSGASITDRPLLHSTSASFTGWMNLLDVKITISNTKNHDNSRSHSHSNGNNDESNLINSGNSTSKKNLRENQTEFVGEELDVSQWKKRMVQLNNGHLQIFEDSDFGKDSHMVLEVPLNKYTEFHTSNSAHSAISNESNSELPIVSFTYEDYSVVMKFDDLELLELWNKALLEEKKKATLASTNTFSLSLQAFLETMTIDGSSGSKIESARSTDSSETRSPEESARERDQQFNNSILQEICPPIMKIVILVVGTRGDVAPFILMGLELKAAGHDVRIATHVDYRKDVQSEGLKYYPLAGDPRKLSEYMVKTHGRLLPDLLNEEERRDLPEKMRMIRDICYSTWPACTAPDPEDETKEAFIADAIISNPVSYGHIHCAEALAVPLHIMFPQPWYPTKSFPHPLSNMGFSSTWSITNKYSFKMVDEFMWLGTGSIVNSFRKEILGLTPIRSGEAGDSLLIDHKVPISHMWSPSFVPKCRDWPCHVDVVGDFSKATSPEIPDSFSPDVRLQEFLDKCGADKPIYIGFGSMVMKDHRKLVEMVKAASAETQFSILMQSGWTKYAEDYAMLSDKIMVVGSLPHSWLFTKVAAVIHHGGAGTTSAGLRADKPTFICPFFGDQHFWAEMVHRAEVGPAGCPIELLTTDKLINAFQVLKSERTMEIVQELGRKMRAENGIKNGINSFLKNLPLEDLLCEVSIFHRKSRIACWYCDDCGLKMSDEVHAAVHTKESGRDTHFCVPYKCVRWGVAPPAGVLHGLGQGLGVAAYEIAGGIYDLVAEPVHGALTNGVTGAAYGMAEGFRKFVARPIHGGGVLIDRVVTGIAASPVRKNRTVAETLRKGKRAKFGSTFYPSDMKDRNKSTDNEESKETSVESFNNKEMKELFADFGSKFLGPMDNSVEKALERALEFKTLWSHIDKSGDRFVDIKELQDVMPPEEARMLFQSADINQDGLLTFAELALKVVSYESGNRDKVLIDEKNLQESLLVHRRTVV